LLCCLAATALALAAHATEPGVPAVGPLPALEAPSGQAPALCPAEEPALMPPAPILDNQVCAWISQSPCPTAGDCGYELVGNKLDGFCCIARCHRGSFLCLDFCIA
jgi:hypothetical protein